MSLRCRWKPGGYVPFWGFTWSQYHKAVACWPVVLEWDSFTGEDLATIRRRLNRQ